MSFCYYLLILFFSLTTQVFSQYSSYNLLPNNATSAGLASSGIALDEKLSSLYANPSLLANSENHIIHIGGTTAAQGNSFNAVRPLGVGFYTGINDHSGWGIKAEQMYYKNYPNDSRLFNYGVYLFGSYRWKNNWFMSLGVGMAYLYREEERSNSSFSPSAQVSYKSPKFVLALSYKTQGKYDLKYRGSDELKEKLPDFLTLGFQYSINPKFTSYSEVTRIFWENSTFKLNKEDERPKFDRGLGTEIKFSTGLQYTHSPKLKLRGGFEFGGMYNEKGQNERTTAFAAGFSYFPFLKDQNEKLSVNFAFLDYSILNKNKREPETIFFLSFGYHITNWLKKDTKRTDSR
ncbi:MAG: hypothetical protein H7A23_24390 [Leptospiraceae bacterium]|nr:hypothetical protein [Leptospiraceae bacterium]MCP5497705.1 hypothetical protein [Leptospiraceae bacterium]